MQLLHDYQWDLKRAVRLSNNDIASIQSLPLNSIFLVLNDGGLIVDEKLYILLRSTGLIGVAKKLTRVESDLDEVGSTKDDKEVLTNTKDLNLIHLSGCFSS